MPDKENLIPASQRTREEAQENGQKGGKKSGEVRRQKKKMKEMMKILLSLDMPESKGKDELRELGIAEEDLNIQTQILMQQINKAMKGNLESAKFVREVSDEIGAIKDDTNTEDRVVIVNDLPGDDEDATS